MGDLASLLTLAVAGLAVVSMAGVALRHAVRIGSTEARLGEAVRAAEEAKSAAREAAARAVAAEKFAARRADAVHAQYVERERQARKRARDHDPEPTDPEETAEDVELRAWDAMLKEPGFRESA